MGNVLSRNDFLSMRETGSGAVRQQQFADFQRRVCELESLGFHSASSIHTSYVTLGRQPNFSELNILILTMEIIYTL